MKKFLIIGSALLSLTGCANQAPLGEHLGKPEVYGELSLRAIVQPWTDWMLKEERSWMGDNLYLDVEVGLEWNHGIKCPGFETGTSIFTGAPFGKKSPTNSQAELHCVPACE